MIAHQWIEHPNLEVPPGLRSAVGGHPLLAQALFRREITDRTAALAFLDPNRYHPSPASDLPDIDKAVDRLSASIRSGELISVWGDFDVDGQTATTVLVATLRSLGARVTYHIPIRANESHGVNTPNLQKVIEQGAQLILTCDTGIGAHDAVAFAQERGVEMIITDHHDLLPTLPPAYAVVNPKRLPENHPSRSLPGVGVAYRVMEALCLHLGRAELVQEHLDLLALGIVADLASVTQDTRYLLQLGLDCLRNTTRLGLRAMYELAEINPNRITEEHIGFILGPRLNALGRLGDANPIVEFFTTQEQSQARIVAAELEGLNAQRRLLCDQVYQAAQAQIERDPTLLDGSVLVLSHPTWPAGVIGIVASRLVEQYNRPTVLIATPEGEPGRGSARSIEGFNISAAISANQHLLLGCGGHPMAAGLAIDPQNIPLFRLELDKTAAKMLGPTPSQPQLYIDGQISLKDLTMQLVEDLERLAPYGPGNPALNLMVPRLVLKSHSAVGRNGDHLQLIVEDEKGNLQKAIWWQGGAQDLPSGRFDLAFHLRASDYRGQREIQVEWTEARPVITEKIELPVVKTTIDIVDYRKELYPLVAIKNICAKEDLQIWSEGKESSSLQGKNRLELHPNQGLVIWNIPPGNLELQTVLEQVKPVKIYLFAQDPHLDQFDVFVTRLTGLVKYALGHQSGQVELPRLAAAMAHRPETVQSGLSWLQAKGYFERENNPNGTIHISPGSQIPDRILVRVAEAQLKARLAETSAYRQYYCQARKEALVGSGRG